MRRSSNWLRSCLSGVSQLATAEVSTSARGAAALGSAWGVVEPYCKAHCGGSQSPLAHRGGSYSRSITTAAAAAAGHHGWTHAWQQPTALRLFAGAGVSLPHLPSASAVSAAPVAATGSSPCSGLWQGGWQLQQRRGFQLRPRRTKFRKAFKSQGFNDVICPNTRQLAWGQFGIRAMEHGRIPAKTIEATRRALRRTIKKSAAMYIRLVPNVPVSSKPAEVRMGKGKGAVDYYAAVVRPGQIMFELDNVNRKLALDALAAAQPKLPIRIGFVEWR